MVRSATFVESPEEGVHITVRGGYGERVTKQTQPRLNLQEAIASFIDNLDPKDVYGFDRCGGCKVTVYYKVKEST